MRYSHLALAFLILGVPLIGMPPCAADPYVTGTCQRLQQGYLVQFTVHNTLTTGTVWEWSVSTADACNLTGPPGWRITQNLREVNWSALGSPASQIPPLHDLGGFGFTTQNAPGTLGWWIGGGGWSWGGTVIPVLIPEPSPLAAILAGLAGFGAVVRRRRPFDRLRMR